MGEWALCTCGPYVLAGLMCLRALCACGPYVLAGLMSLRALRTCEPYVLVGLIYLRAPMLCIYFLHGGDKTEMFRATTPTAENCNERTESEFRGL